MGWEKRGNKKYYYRKKRIGKKVNSEYIGSGPVAEKIAQEDELNRRRQNKEKQVWQRRKIEIEAMDDLLYSLDDITRKLIYANLILAGYHTHKYEWRKKRDG